MEEKNSTGIEPLIAAGNLDDLRTTITSLPLPDIAELLMDAGMADRVLIYRMLPTHLAAEVASYLKPDELHTLIRELSEPEAGQLMANLRPDDRTYFLGELPGQVARKLINLLGHDDLKETRALLGYPERSVGRLMTPDYIAVRAEWTVEQVLAHIRRWGAGCETISAIHVTDDRWTLLKIMDLKDVLLAAPETTVAALATRQAVSVKATDDREYALAIMQRHDLHALPVVDSHGIILGIVTSDDMLDVAQTAATEDFHRASAVSPLAANYTQMGVTQLVDKRIWWLVGLMLANIAAGGVVAIFEGTLERKIALAFFMPMLICCAGNIGTQISTIIIRSLVTKDLAIGRWVYVIGKETIVSGAIGVIMGLVGYGLGFWRGGADLAMVIGLTMLLLAIVANLLGAILPFIFTRLKMDPAVVSGPLVTTAADIIGLAIYFSVAWYFLG